MTVLTATIPAAQPVPDGLASSSLFDLLTSPKAEPEAPAAVAPTTEPPASPGKPPAQRGAHLSAAPPVLPKKEKVADQLVRLALEHGVDVDIDPSGEPTVQFEQNGQALLLLIEDVRFADCLRLWLAEAGGGTVTDPQIKTALATLAARARVNALTAPPPEPPPASEPAEPAGVEVAATEISPRMAEYQAFWDRCLRLDDPRVPADVVAYFRRRALDPAWLVGDAPDDDLARVIPPDIEMPKWAWGPDGRWSETQHLIVFPAYNAHGNIALIRARCIDPACSNSRKELVPKKESDDAKIVPGTVPANRIGRLLLAVGPEALSASLDRQGLQLVVIVCEGSPDFWSLCAWARFHAPQKTLVAIYANYSGAWTDGLAARLPAGCRVVVRNHSDTGGCGFRDVVEETLHNRRCVVETRHPDGIPTATKRPDENDDLKALGLDGINPLEGNTPRPAPPRGGWPLTDLGNAERLVHRHGADLRFCPDTGTWYAFNGALWAPHKPDQPSDVERRAELTVRAIPENESKTVTPERAEQIREWAENSESDYAIRAMVRRARVNRSVEVQLKQLDADPYLIGVGNGVLSLTKRKLVANPRSALVTRQVAAPYDPLARAPILEKTLLEIFEEKHDVIDYVQRAIGYSLWGLKTEKQAFICLGPGGDNGKSLLLAYFAWLLGGYGRNFLPSLMFDRRGDRANFSASHLEGLRYASISEISKDAKISTDDFKRFVGGTDGIEAESKGVDSRTFEITWAMWIALNALPQLPVDDLPLVNRMRFIPFLRTFSKDEQDKLLRRKIEAEATGALAWAVRGYEAYMERGLEAPASILAYNLEVKKQADSVLAFVESECETNPLLEAGATELYEVYRSWCAAGGTAVSQKAFSSWFYSRGYQKRREGNATCLVGIALAVRPVLHINTISAPQPQPQQPPARRPASMDELLDTAKKLA